MPMDDSKEAKGVCLRDGHTCCRERLIKDKPWVWQYARSDEYLYEDDLKTQQYFCDICGEPIE
jgi:hypothetical protein